MSKFALEKSNEELPRVQGNTISGRTQRTILARTPRQRVSNWAALLASATTNWTHWELFGSNLNRGAG
ncbi:hypothetical protein JG688_00015245 [Phytophthora aleatoria]|uniref:Uncharacterized protein n=1 Tax=Phytophthora aleatoria TaxID=2496075 RepID=A0A8J5LZN7_9STRA|nr:hypothetical protein JG688_00015245 [Phytophthora aleatoria]